MECKTNVMRILDSKKINYQAYDYSKTDAISGVEVATVLNQNIETVFKTLVTIGKSKQHYIFMIPVAQELDLKKAANIVSEKSIEMIHSKDLLPLTGYIHGGCSPIGMKKSFPIIIHHSIEDLEEIIFSAGKIGYQVKIKVEDLNKVISYQIANITNEL